MLSHEAITLFIGTHYSATWIGYMLCAFVDGAAWLATRSMVLAKLGLVAAMGISIWTSEYYSPTSPGYFLARKPDTNDALKEQALSTLPTDASIWSDEQIFAHLGLHPNAMIDGTNQEFRVYDIVDDVALWNGPDVRTLLRKNAYRIALRRGTLVVLRATRPRSSRNRMH